MPNVDANKLGLVYDPRAVIQIGEHTQVEPDLMVRQPQSDPAATWRTAPADVVTRDEYLWHPSGALLPLTVRVADVFS